MPTTRDILEKLISFATVSRRSNMALIGYVQGLLQDKGIACDLVASEDGTRANLYATVGPKDRGGVMLSGHSDVVPVEGQPWTVDPFEMLERDGKLYGRGTTDMKGFLASSICAMRQAAEMDLKIPLHLAISYDEEIGCIGVKRLIEVMKEAPVKPKFCIVGEPTSMGVATGHKGKLAARATFTGRASHSALAPKGLNAIHLAAEAVTTLRALQNELATNGARDEDYEIPYTTIHAGIIAGGLQINIVPETATLDFEIRAIAQDAIEAIYQRINVALEASVAAYREEFSEADVGFEIVNSYPGLSTAPDADVVSFVKSLTGANDTIKVAFGTEGGLFDKELQLETVVCGPGSMDQGHKPDEFVAINQLELCDRMMAKLLEHLSA